ncbi:MAG TPA: hypothetical protein VD996_05490 [Chitinophagaceae bacterium]|nr:hypothetical protein [Chitinophagaceae bacterium]
MRPATWVVMTPLLLAANGHLAQTTSSGNQFQLSVQNGLSSFAGAASADSVHFLKQGYHAAVEGNYFWNNVGLAGTVGYLSNGSNRQSLEDVARRRKAPMDRISIESGAARSIYFLAGPAFQGTFHKWRAQSSIKGGLISRPARQVVIGDNASPDVVYYRNVFEKGTSFGWSAGLGLSYSLSRNLLLGVNADYLNTKNDVTNYDILRGNGREARNISGQPGFLNTGVKLSYVFGKPASREAGSGIATGRRQYIKPRSATFEDEQSDTCKCENKIMEVREMKPYVIEIQVASVAEAKEFLDTYQPILEKREAGSGLATGKRQHKPMASHGIVYNNAFYVLPTELDLAEVLTQEDGKVTVTVAGRETGSGLATGRRQHKPMTVTRVSNDSSAENHQQKAGVSTSRSNIRTHKSLSVSDGICVTQGEIELNGRLYSVVITSRHDTPKNSVGNIR